MSGSHKPSSPCSPECFPKILLHCFGWGCRLLNILKLPVCALPVLFSFTQMSVTKLASASLKSTASTRVSPDHLVKARHESKAKEHGMHTPCATAGFGATHSTGQAGRSTGRTQTALRGAEPAGASQAARGPHNASREYRGRSPQTPPTSPAPPLVKKPRSEVTAAHDSTHGAHSPPGNDQEGPQPMDIDRAGSQGPTASQAAARSSQGRKQDSQGTQAYDWSQMREAL